jgi:two-component system CheB/CheR fusion protein
MPNRASPEKAPSQPTAKPLIVGIGASAGGLEAFTTFLEYMPADSGLAFVLVQHLAPDQESALAELLDRHTAMPVLAAEDGAPVEPDHVYTIVPNATLTIEGGCLRLEEPAPARPDRHPIDSFLDSLAADQGENAIGIILSGLGSDGTPGARSIKEHGGLMLAEEEAAHHRAKPGMPQSAAQSGMVDAILAVEAMPARLMEYRQALADVAGDKDAQGLRRDARGQLAQIMALLNKHAGHDFSHYKDKTVIRRVQRRMQVERVESMAAYVERLRENPREREALFREMLIGVTEFFRDPPAWEALKTRVIAKLVAHRGAADTIRVWVPGCATGEEAYSIAILLAEALAGHDNPPRVQIFGTDLDERAIETARRARYRKPLKGLSRERRERWFLLENNVFSPVKEIREMCIFSPQSIARDPPFSNLDLVSCRNLLIYLNAELQDTVLRKLHYALKPGGYLFLGLSESVARGGKLFNVLDQKQRIFKRSDVAPSPVREFAPSKAAPRAGQAGAGLTRFADDRIDTHVRRAIERQSPAWVVIDRHHDILRFSGGEAAPYLEPTGGAASLNLFNLLRQGLRVPARVAVKNAFETGEPVREDNLAIAVDETTRTLSLAVEPVAIDADRPELCVIVFRDTGGAVESATDGEAADALEKQVRGLKAQLDAALTELEARNEEMMSVTEEHQSVNEELQSSNEELETAKEEMQSINEELQTINGELNSKNEQLTQLNDDLRNLLESTEIATIFLDDNLEIKSFTPGMRELFHLRDSDRGRPLTDLVTRMNYSTLKTDVDRVLDEMTVIEREVRVHGLDAIFLMRIRPYRTVAGDVDGVVITFVDISARQHETEAHRDLLLQELSHRVKNTLATVGSIAAQTLKNNPSPRAFQAEFNGRLKTLSQTHDLLTRSQWRGTGMRELVEMELAPYGGEDDGRWTLDGRDACLNPKAALAVGLALHELTTNAVKYGALSVPEGRIEVAWRVEAAEAGRTLHLDWTERGGPPVKKKPKENGFGLKLIQGLDYELAAKVALDFKRRGLECRIELPLKTATEKEPG